MPSAFASSSAMPVPDLDSLMVLEAPFARSPYEDLRRRLRTHQRITDRDFASINTLVSDLTVQGGQDGRREMLEKVDAIIERVRGMKEKVRIHLCILARADADTQLPFSLSLA